MEGDPLKQERKCTNWTHPNIQSSQAEYQCQQLDWSHQLGWYMSVRTTIDGMYIIEWNKRNSHYHEFQPWISEIALSHSKCWTSHQAHQARDRGSMICLRAEQQRRIHWEQTKIKCSNATIQHEVSASSIPSVMVFQQVLRNLEWHD